MSSFSTVHGLSVYQLVQQTSNSWQELLISPNIFQSYLTLTLELLKERQISTEIWLKLPQTKTWLGEIEKYLQQDNIKHIYWYGNQKNHPAFLLPESQLTTKITPIKIVNNSLLKKESFLIVVSPQLSCLILAQWQKAKISTELTNKRVQQPYLKAVLSFESSLIKTVITELNQLIFESESSQTILPDLNDISSENPEETQLITDLLRKQIEYTETLQNSLNALANNQSKTNSFAQFVEVQSEFLNKLVRELRSPITRMKTALSLLESKQIKGEQRQRYLEILDYECDRQNSLISGLLELLQLEIPFEVDSVRLEDLVPGIVSTYQPLAQEKQILLGYTIPSNLPPVACPSSWLRQIIIHLLNNSLQFTPAQGKVFVQATINNEFVELAVSDTGIGIDPQELTKIFDSFYRIRSTENEHVAGAGLGLTIVQQLAQKCGGSIAVSSKVGKGSVFKVLLPITLAELTDA
ncbi:histidine kinase [Stanieria sp. NIES-3757]|nr:histidine kinase [Stanieria sp. NIES-3757]